MNTESMGKLLITGIGKGHAHIKQTWVLGIVVAIISIVVGLVVAFILGYREVPSSWGPPSQVRTALYYIGPILGVLVAGVVMFIWTPMRCRLINKCKISVFEHGIIGTSAVNPTGGGEIINQITTFTLLYSQISSIEVPESGNTLVVNAQGKGYLVYASNAREIAEAINNRLHQT
jgi:hypothetical protein